MPPAVQIEIAKLAGKRAGYVRVREMLGRNPCDPDLNAYRLSGPLKPKVCGLHLKNGYRLAFSMQPPDVHDLRGRVVILYVGKREPGHRAGARDVWDLLHELFGTESPAEGHHKPPCCDEDRPQIRDDELLEFISTLRAVQRGRGRPRSA